MRNILLIYYLNYLKLGHGLGSRDASGTVPYALCIMHRMRNILVTSKINHHNPAISTDTSAVHGLPRRQDLDKDRAMGTCEC